jgi:glutaredoxin 3
MMSMRKVEIYTTKWCPYCHAAKALFEEKGVPYEEVDAGDPETRRAMIQRAHGRRTVPQVFVGDQHLGGYREVVMLESDGRLESLIGGGS